MVITRVYIDGFNLYHGIIRENRLHWLDLSAFARRLNRGDPVERVLYCTAMVSSTPNDPDKAQRQDVYHRALAVACPTVDIILGMFTTHRKWQAVTNCSNSPACAVKVSVRNEKGSDVNLAARLLHDAHAGRYDRAIVVSGDSDLVEPIRLVTAEVGKVVWVRNPRDRASAELEAVASDYARIRPSVLQNAQLPDPVSNGVLTYSKPPKWSQATAARTRTAVLSTACPQGGCGKTVETCRWQ
jgi:uncharacterized LabA/DUF88 family protein